MKEDQLVNNRADELSLYLNNSTAKSIEEAKAWINKVDDDPSIWNVFLFGNISTIEAAIDQWTESLNLISKKKTSSETDPEEFSTANVSKEKALLGLANLKSIYQEAKAPNASAIITLLISYLLLLCPYFVQERHSRNVERFFGTSKVKLNPKNKGDNENNNNKKYDTF